MSSIELVIKMDEETYKHIISTQFCIGGLRNGKSLLEQILKAIRTGTPLPKGHGRLIDADKLRAVYTKPHLVGFDEIIEDIDSQPTVVEGESDEE